MSIKPLADRILVKPLAAEEKTIGGIIIPDSAKEKPAKGEIIAVGTGTKEEEMILKVGDIILYGKYAGTEIEHEGEKFLIMRMYLVKNLWNHLKLFCLGFLFLYSFLDRFFFFFFCLFFFVLVWFDFIFGICVLFILLLPC